MGARLFRSLAVLRGTFLALSIGGFAQASVAAPQSYVHQPTLCDGFPRAGIDMAAGLCAGIVAAPPEGGFRNRRIKTPRMLLQLQDPHRWLVTDLGAWTAGRGRVWVMEVDEHEETQVTAIVTGLTLPHTVAFGPDGNVYVAEMNRIFRLDVDSGATVTVVAGLPGNRLHIGRHPLSHFVFDGNGDLLVNVGADTDQCVDASGKPKAPICAEAEGNDARAVIRRYRYQGSGHWDSNPTILARGLRNSLVLLRHPSGTILQAENSYDFAPTADRPFDEINVIHEGAHYGWPYCYDTDQPTPAWAAVKTMDCSSSAHERPAVLLPPHSAPLGAVYYTAGLFPSLQGKLLMSWHGYRPTGSRIVAFDVDARGVPTTKAHALFPEYTSTGGVALKNYGPGPGAEPTVLTPGWDLKPGVRPAGGPVGLTVARDGAIWVADDRNAAILRIAADRG
ncbi:MAG TPA: PQQ-dependent sugar dehydrogenase [Steroidobacteraceae bacterium]|jgi:glucose/arabinose dehydrogenase